MKAKIIIGAMCLLATSANAAIPYRVEQVVMPAPQIPDGNDDEALARVHRYYVGASYDFSMWQSYTDKNDIHVEGKDSSSFDIVVGMRIYDTFRVEANYARTVAKIDDATLYGNTMFLNGIFDARIDSLYRLFRKQYFVPYVGAGIGLSGNTIKDVEIKSKLTPVVNAMAGLGIELGEYFTIDVGYRYFYMFSPKFEGIDNLNPAAHQLRAGVRVNF